MTIYKLAAFAAAVVFTATLGGVHESSDDYHVASVKPLADDGADDGADDDDPGYQIGGDQPGLQNYPNVCATVKIACALHRDPGSGAWIRPAPEPEH